MRDVILAQPKMIPMSEHDQHVWSLGLKIGPKASARMRLPDAKWPVFASQNIY